MFFIFNNSYFLTVLYDRNKLFRNFKIKFLMVITPTLQTKNNIDFKNRLSI